MFWNNHYVSCLPFLLLCKLTLSLIKAIFGRFDDSTIKWCSYHKSDGVNGRQNLNNEFIYFPNTVWVWWKMAGAILLKVLSACNYDRPLYDFLFVHCACVSAGQVVSGLSELRIVIVIVILIRPLFYFILFYCRLI